MSSEPLMPVYVVYVAVWPAALPPHKLTIGLATIKLDQRGSTYRMVGDWTGAAKILAHTEMFV